MKPFTAGLLSASLFSAWPILALAARNPRGYASTSEFVAGLVAAVGVAALMWSLTIRLGGNRNTRAVVCVVLVAAWWGFAAVVDPLRSSGALPTWVPDWLLALVGVAFAWALAQRWPALPNRATYMLVVTGLLLVLSAGTQVMLRRPAWKPLEFPGLSLPEQPRAATTALPDVVMLILDAYTGATSLQKNYGFDNQPFLEALRHRGFVTPEGFHSNYPGTAAAVVGLLNWEYVHEFADGLDTTSWDRGQLEPYAEESRTWRFFTTLGYDIVYVPGAFTGRNRYATDELSFEVRAFTRAWLAMTPVRSLPDRLGYAKDAQSGSRQAQAEASRHDERFRFIAARARGRRPTLTFAHILLPHDPYVYHADCRHRVPPLEPWFDRTIPETIDRAAYLQQLTCTNKQVIALVDTLIGRRTEPPVILLLSDHGRSTMRFGVVPLDEATPTDVAERLDNLGAFLVPDSVRKAFEAVRTPIGAMRALVREVFGVHVGDVEERAYWSAHRRPFRFSPLVLSAAPPGSVWVAMDSMTSLVGRSKSPR